MCSHETASSRFPKGASSCRWSKGTCFTKASPCFFPGQMTEPSAPNPGLPPGFAFLWLSLRGFSPIRGFRPASAFRRRRILRPALRSLALQDLQVEGVDLQRLLQAHLKWPKTNPLAGVYVLGRTHISLSGGLFSWEWTSNIFGDASHSPVAQPGNQPETRR